MLAKRTLLAVVVGLFLVSPATVQGDDLADLQTAYKQYAAALSQQDADATMAFFHDEAGRKTRLTYLLNLQSVRAS